MFAAMILSAFTAMATGCGKSDQEVPQLLADRNQACSAEKDNQKQQLEKDFNEKLKEELEKLEIELTAKLNGECNQKLKNQKCEEQSVDENKLEKTVKDIISQVMGTGDNVVLLKKQLASILFNFLSPNSLQGYYYDAVTFEKVFDDRTPEAKNLLLQWLVKNQNQAIELLDNTLKALQTDEEKAKFVKNIAILISAYEEAVKLYPKFKNIMKKHPDHYPPYETDENGKFKKTGEGENIEKRFPDKEKDALHQEYEDLDEGTKFTLRALKSLDSKGGLNLVKKLVEQIKEKLGI